MLCPKCRVKVNGRAKVCPLCHGILTDGGESQENEPRMFPEYNRRTPLTNPILDKLYLWLAFFISIAAIVCNAVFFRSAIWSPLLIIVLFYGYFLIRNTLLDAKNFCVKLLFQVFLISLVLTGVQIAIYPNLVIAQFVIPALHVLADVVMAAYLLKMWRRPRQFTMPLVSGAIFSVTPVLFLFLFGIKDWEYALICAGFGLIIAIVSAAAYHKLLFRELVRFFHI